MHFLLINWVDFSEKLVNMSEFYKGLSVLLLSAVPLIEQRGAIPLGFFLDINPLLVFVISYLGSLIPVPFILLLFNLIFTWMKKYKIFKPFNNFIEKKLQKNTPKIEKYKEIGLMLLFAIPLPTI